jgi:hypothetical protein
MLPNRKVNMLPTAWVGMQAVVEIKIVALIWFAARAASASFRRIELSPKFAKGKKKPANFSGGFGACNPYSVVSSWWLLKCPINLWRLAGIADRL